MKKETYKVQGMTCTACSRTVERVTKKLEGVENANVNFATETLTISYDTKKVKIDSVKKAIEKAGYRLVDSKEETLPEDKMQKLWKNFIYSAIFSVPLFLLSMVPMLLMTIHIHLPSYLNPMEYPILHACIQIVLVIPVMIVGRGYYKRGFLNLIHLSPNMDSLIAVSTTASFLYGIYAVWQTGITNQAQDYYFESIAVILTLITLGKYFEAKAKGKTSQAIQKLIDLSPKTAICIIDGKEVELQTEQISLGTVVIVKPGMKIPLDGTIVQGETYIDESMITGESIPVKRGVQDFVVGGSINTNRNIQVEVTKVGKDTVLSQIVKLVQEAQGAKLPIARLADIISGIFVPVVIVLAILAAIAWAISGQDLEFCIKIFVSVLVIACPCALGLATPTAIMVATGKAAENGILIKNGASLELLHQIKTILFDKTGTITEGKPKVTDFYNISSKTDAEVLSYVLSLEKKSEHPLALAMVEFAKNKAIELKEVSEFESITGKGIKGKIEEKEIVIGNKALCEQVTKQKDISQIENKLYEMAKTVIYIVESEKIIGIIGITDAIKENSKRAIEELNHLHIKSILITGDNIAVAKSIAQQAGIPEVLAQVTPKDKAEKVKQLQQEGEKVAMTGDGINDSPALATADIGIAIGAGTDIAIESADIILMKNDLEDVVTSVRLSTKTIQNIKENLFWAFGYNVLGIPVAMGLLYAFGGPLLNPMIAAAAMSLSSVSVLANALRLRSFK